MGTSSVFMVTMVRLPMVTLTWGPVGGADLGGVLTDGGSFLIPLATRSACQHRFLTSDTSSNSTVRPAADPDVLVPTGHAQPSLSRRFDVSYCEIRRGGQRGLLLRTAMTNAILGCNGFVERYISRCETHLGLRNRLNHASSRAIEVAPLY
jgi:hypothetical protein